MWIREEHDGSCKKKNKKQKNPRRICFLQKLFFVQDVEQVDGIKSHNYNNLTNENFKSLSF